jgi:hypothetical protein
MSSPAAVAPLNTIAPQDLKKSADKFDAWLRKISNDVLTLERMSMVAGSLPVLGNLLALVDLLNDVVGIVEKTQQGAEVEVLEWLGLGINVIGLIPAPGTGPARVALRPALHAIKAQLVGVAKSQISGALVEALAGHLHAHFPGEMDTFIDEAMPKLEGILQQCADFTDSLGDYLISLLQGLSGQQTYSPCPLHRPPPTTTHPPNGSPSKACSPPWQRSVAKSNPKPSKRSTHGPKSDSKTCPRCFTKALPHSQST